MATTTEALRETIRTTLARRDGTATGTSAVTEVALGTWHQMTTRLAPVIGTRGVDVLFRRSLNLTSATFPWLAILGDDGNTAALIVELETRFASQAADAAVEARFALLVTFTELLATLIGEPLTERLLRPVWLTPPAACEQETAR
jgi:hypothetical protein